MLVCVRAVTGVILLGSTSIFCTSLSLAAEPWEGTWVYRAEDVARCVSSEDVAQAFSNVRGIVISRNSGLATYWQASPGKDTQTLRGEHGAILGYENGEDFWECRIGKVTRVNQLEAWIFDVECGGEGSIWPGRTMAMLTGDPPGIATYNLGWEAELNEPPGVTQLYRCPPPAPRPKP